MLITLPTISPESGQPFRCFAYMENENGIPEIRGYFFWTANGITQGGYQKYIIQENQLLDYGWEKQDLSVAEVNSVCTSHGITSLQYKPELNEIYFPLINCILVSGILLLAYRIVLWRFIK